MLFERIESKGLAHHSYILGDEGLALVIDPRRDCDIYVEFATLNAMRIAYILETHRNEDYVVGSVELAARTGAEIWHADAHLDYRYGQAVEDGQTWQVGRLQVRAIHSPGHTLGSMSYLLHDPGGAPWILFTGDALFAGEVGRVDFMGMDRAEEMARLLHETLYEKFLPLGDQVLVCPAHGSGSVCGSAIAERVWTTIGLERQLNPKLQYTNRDDFVANHVRELAKPAYFSRVEQWNLEGAPLLDTLPLPVPLAPADFVAHMEDAVVLDTRSTLAFSAGHVPGAQSIWLDGVPMHAGWFLPQDRPLLLVHETDDPRPVVRFLIRLGFDNLIGYLAGGMLSWHDAGLDSASIQAATSQALRGRVDRGESFWILDVRSDEEFEDVPLAGACHIPVTQLTGRVQQIPRQRPIAVSCGMGLRAMVVASFLRRQGWHDVTAILGSLTTGPSTTAAPT